MQGLGKRALLFIGVHVFGLVLLALTALAHEDGALVGLHDLRTERGLLCMTDHFHVGSGKGLPTRKEAEREAVASWAGFTAWEYGDHWGNFRLAGSKSMKCAENAGSWSCETQARPCRPLARKAVRGATKKRRAKQSKR